MPLAAASGRAPADPVHAPVAPAVFAAMAGWVMGSALQLQQRQLLENTVNLALLLLAAVLALTCWRCARFFRQRPMVRVLLALLAGLLLGLALCGLRSAHYLSNSLAPEIEGRDIELEARVVRMPQRGEVGVRLMLQPQEAWLAGQRIEVPQRILLGWYGGPHSAGHALAAADRPDPGVWPPQVQAGDLWRLTARLKAPHGQINPHGFDYELWLWEQGVQALGTVRQSAAAQAPKLLERGWRHPVERLRQGARDAVFEQVSDPRQAGIVAALLAGDQNAIERADWDVFRASGVAHLMSISGLHITMFAWLTVALVGWFWRRSGRLCLWLPAQHAALLLGLLAAAGYALFSGWGVPAQRTILMLATVVLLRLSGRRWPWPWIWLLACTLVVALDPWALSQAGFWLSFVAVGVLFASGTGMEIGGGVGRRLLAMLREQWVITLALTPLTLLLFQQVSLVGLLANLLAIPWVTLLVTPLAMLGLLLPALWDGAAWAIQLLSWYLQWLVKLPHSTVTMAAAPLWIGAAGVFGGLMLVLRWPLPLRLGGLLFMFPLLLWQPVRPAVGEFEVLAADVGQGNALIVRTAFHTLVYDAGPRYSVESDAGQRVLVPLLRALAERVDILLLSHRDSDHTGGAGAVLAMQPQARLLSSLEDGHDLLQLRSSERCLDAREGGQRWLWDGVQFEILSPRASDYLAGARSNALSCVLRISNGRAAALLTGDIEQTQEAALAQGLTAPGNAMKLRADLLLVPHHGSKTSSSLAFLQAVSPSVAVVQAGYRNRFGHPAAPVLQRYRELGIPVFDSPRCGAALWQSNAPGSVACQRLIAQRYWHHRMP